MKADEAVAAPLKVNVFWKEAYDVVELFRIVPSVGWQGGPGDDMTPFGEFECVVGAPLAEVKSLLSQASLFVGNDSGPAHIAAAFNVPLAVLFGRTEHQITWAPWKATAARTLVDPRGITAIAAGQVINAVDELLRPDAAR